MPVHTPVNTPPSPTERKNTESTKRKIDRDLICLIHRDYSDGMGYGELSKKYGFSRSSIHDAFQRYNLPTALIRVDPLDKRMTAEVVARVTELYQGGHTLEQVSHAFLGAFTPRDIKRILQKHNVKRRVRSDYETIEQIDRRKFHPMIISMYVNEHLPVTVIALRLGLPETYCRRTLQRSGVRMRNRNDYNPETYKQEARALIKSRVHLPATDKPKIKQPLIATHKHIPGSSLPMPALKTTFQAADKQPPNATSLPEELPLLQQQAQKKQSQPKQSLPIRQRPSTGSATDRTPQRPSQQELREKRANAVRQQSYNAGAPTVVTTTKLLPILLNQSIERDPERGTRLVSSFDTAQTDAKWELVKPTVSFPTNNGNGKQNAPTRFVSRKRKFDSFD
jgi:hypothetical protein